MDPLFDGKTLSGWKVGANASTFSVDSGMIIVHGPTAHLFYDGDVQQHNFKNFEFKASVMTTPGSNSGIYLQGRYEIQLLDSWTSLTTKAGDNGGIYERWDDSKPDGQKGYDGHAPRQNATRAPGLWQHIKISFQAPRFNQSGQKIENARILRVELNGVLLHENVELSGPTRGPLVNDEVATGPLRFQGDHGPVAFRNIQLTSYDKPKPELADLADLDSGTVVSDRVVQPLLDVAIVFGILHVDEVDHD